jgi:hypothetical protein
MSSGKLYRLYIDESGDHNYSSSDLIKKRYLGLTGIFIEKEIYENDVQPRILNIKKLFTTDPDNLAILHHEDIINKTKWFTKLFDQDVEEEFNKQLISLVKDVNYTICCVVIDKKIHFQKYKTSAEHPYHYCLKSMMERYTHFLEKRGRGDVMAETRGKKEDNALQTAYSNFYFNGTYFRSPKYVQAVLTTNEIKIKGKDKGIAGLEFADLLSLVTKLDVLRTFEAIPDLAENFNKRLIGFIQEKYCRGNNTNRIKGYGKKML